ncbi:hypothetical protein I3760_10G166800 [Carya illinoinensis]|nr:hypothetical protein I3760_10G166800 [Carya illinoinensis]
MFLCWTLALILGERDQTLGMLSLKDGISVVPSGWHWDCLSSLECRFDVELIYVDPSSASIIFLLGE